MRVWGVGLRVEGVQCRVEGLRSRVEGLGLGIRVLGLGLMPESRREEKRSTARRELPARSLRWASWLRVEGLGDGVWGVGHRVLGVGSRI